MGVYLMPLYRLKSSSGGSTTTGSGAPTTTPTGAGDIYIDTDSGYTYIASGTTGADDWQQSSGDASTADAGYAFFVSN